MPDKLQGPPVCTRTEVRHVDRTTRVSCSVSFTAKLHHTYVGTLSLSFIALVLTNFQTAPAFLLLPSINIVALTSEHCLELLLNIDFVRNGGIFLGEMASVQKRAEGKQRLNTVPNPTSERDPMEELEKISNKGK